MTVRTTLALGAVAALLAGCGGSGGKGISSVPDTGNQVQVASNPTLGGEGATISKRLEDAGYRVLGSAPPLGVAGGFAVQVDGGGIVIVLVLPSGNEAKVLADGMRQTPTANDALLLRQVGRHLYAANTTAGASALTVDKADFAKVVAAAESSPG